MTSFVHHPVDAIPRAPGSRQGLDGPCATTQTTSEVRVAHNALMRRFPSVPVKWLRRTSIFRSGELVCSVRQTGPVTVFILNGWACRSRALFDGRRQILELLLPGDSVSLDDRDLQSGVYLTALRKCEVAVVLQADVEAEMAESPTLAAEILRADRRRRALLEEMIVSLGQRDALARTAHLFCEVMTRSVSKAVSGSACPFPLTQIDLASMLGFSIVHANRTIGALRKERSADMRAGRLTATDFKTLTNRASFDAAYLA